MMAALRVFGLLLVMAIGALSAPVRPSPVVAAPLTLEQTIPLPGVQGRIDHLDIDLVHHRLFVAALGNGSVEAVDLSAGKVSGRITGLSEPKGVAWLSGRDELVVASGDGLVRFYRAADLSALAQLKLGDDADNVRVDPAGGRVVVGYGAGALAIIDPAARKVVATLPLSAHPESFRIDAAHQKVFVNLPGAGQIAVGDLAAARVTATRRVAHMANYPMLFDPAAGQVMVVYRLPARLVITSADTGAAVQDIDTCGDSDDLFLDARRQRLYVSCGSGDVDVFEKAASGYRRLARIKTSSGARTSLFVPELDRLFVAARAEGGHAAAIMVFRPTG